MEIFIVLIAGIGFLVSEYLVFSLVYALCMAVAGLCNGYTVQRLDIYGFIFENQDGKMKFYISDDGFRARTSLCRKDITAKIRIRYESLLMILYTCVEVATVVVAVKKLNIKNPYVICAIVCTVIIWLFYFYAYFSLIKIALSKGELNRFWEEDMIARNFYSEGGRPRDYKIIDVDMNTTNPLGKRCILYNYFYYLDNRDYGELEKYIRLFEKYINNMLSLDTTYIPYIYELIYYYSVIDTSLEVAENYLNLIPSIIENDMDANGRRVYAAYQFGTKKPKAAVEQTIRQGIEATKSEKTYILSSKMEYDLLNELKDKLYEKIYEEKLLEE